VGPNRYGTKKQIKIPSQRSSKSGRGVSELLWGKEGGEKKKRTGNMGKWTKAAPDAPREKKMQEFPGIWKGETKSQMVCPEIREKEGGFAVFFAGWGGDGGTVATLGGTKQGTNGPKKKEVVVQGNRGGGRGKKGTKTKKGGKMYWSKQVGWEDFKG